MATGTAPRKVNGVWVTRKGRKLSDAGQTYWNAKLASGQADGKGGYKKSGIGGGASVTTKKPAPAGDIGASSSATGRVKKSVKTPGSTPNVRYTPQLAKAAAAIRRDQALGKINVTEAQDRLAKLNVYGGRKLSKAERYPTPHGVGGWTAKLIGGLAQDTVGLPAGTYFLARHPKKGGKAILDSYKQMAEHPGRMFKEHPDQFLLNLLPAYGAAGKAVVAADAARAAEGGLLAKAAAAGKASVRMTPRRVRSVKLGGVKLDIPKDATPSDAAAIRAAAAPVEIARFSSRNRLTHGILTARDKSLMRRVGAEAPSRNLNIGSPDAAIGRELSRQYQGRLGRSYAPAAAFERFARGKERLTPVEEKALEMAARGHSAETFVKAHLSAREQAIAKLDGAGPKAVAQIEHSTAHHGAHAELAQQAGALLHAPTPRMKAVLGEARALMVKRERDLGMTAGEIAHSLGKAHDEIAAMAEGRISLAQQIAELESKVKLDAGGEEQLAALHKQAIEIGKQAQDKGAFYLPFKTNHPMRSYPAASRSSTAIGPPKVPKVKPLTGQAFRAATYRTDAARLLADASREGAKTAVARHYWSKILALSKTTEDAAGGKFAIPMRTTTKIPDEYRQAVIRPLRGDLTPQEIADAAHTKDLLLQQWRFPAKNEIDAATGTIRGTSEKVRWVDRRLVGGLLVKQRGGALTVGGKDLNLGAAFDTINAVPKLLTLAKPGYALNRVQQFIQNLSQQGVFLRANGRFVEALHQHLNPADLYELQAMAGVGRSRVLAPEAGALKATITKTANFMGRHTDDVSRMLALAHELRTAGFDTVDKVRAALRSADEKTQIKLEAIQTRVNQEAIPFGKMSEAEKRTIARVFFFWPWTRAALEWTARFPFEHPFQASVAGNVGNYGADQVKRIMGPGPSWAGGLIPLTGGRSPLTINLANLNTPQTAVDTAELAKSFVSKSNPYANTDSPASQLGPGAAALHGLFTGTIRGRGSYAPVDAAWRAAVDSIPEVQVSKRLNKPDTAVYPGGVTSAISTPFGGAFPRKTNVDALNKQAEQAASAKRNPTQRILHDHMTFRQELFAAAKETGLVAPTSNFQPKAVREAITLRTERYARYAGAGLKKGDPQYQQKALEIDTAYLLKTGQITQAQADKALTLAKTLIPEELRAKRVEIGRHYFGGATITEAKDEIKLAGAKKAIAGLTQQLLAAGKITPAQARTGQAWLKAARSHTAVLDELHKIVQEYGLPMPQLPVVPNLP